MPNAPPPRQSIGAGPSVFPIFSVGIDGLSAPFASEGPRRVDRHAARARSVVAHTSTHAGRSTAIVAGILFVGALGYHADTGGVTFYVNGLTRGVSRAPMALQIARGPEVQVPLVRRIELGWISSATQIFSEEG